MTRTSMTHYARIAVALGAFSCGPEVTPATKPPTPPPSASAPRADYGAPFAAALDAYVSSFGRHWGDASAFSGYVAVAREGKIVFGKGYGKADRETGVVAGRDTLFRIGSTSKPFTAVGILQLAERGLLRVDDPVRKYLPDLPPMADAVTIRNCLTHTSGLPPLPDDPGLVVETGHVHPVGAAFERYKSEALHFPPGEKFEYSNTGYQILAAILERVTGESYEQYFRAHVFGPAGMRRTTTVSTPRPTNMALGYSIDEHESIGPAQPITYVTFGSGAILSTVDDLVAFDRALAGTTLLSEASKRQMFTPDKDVGALVSLPARYAFGWFVAEDAGHGVLFHAGGVDGFQTELTRVPDAGIAVIVLSNVVWSSLATKIADAAREVALTGRSPAIVEERAPTPFNPAELTSLEGDYGMDAPSMATTKEKLAREADSLRGASLTTANGRLFVTFSGPPREVFRDADGALFTKQSGQRLTPEKDSTGKISGLVVTWMDHGRFRARYDRLGTHLDVDASLGACPVGMVRLPGGAFDATQRIEPFCIDLTEVTVAAYERCARSHKCAGAPTTTEWDGISQADRAKWSPLCNGKRGDRSEHPANCVTWAQSTAYCAAQGRRLPTAAEWEWAARGGAQERTYPWGYGAPAAQVCWSGVEKREGTCAVGAFTAGDALGGIHDLAGNVWEWTSDATGVASHVVRGSGWRDVDAESLRATAHPPPGEATFRGPTVGFRCAK